MSLRQSFNQTEPQIMHIDLNSCFAMMEQQAYPHLRGRPVGVTNRLTEHATMIALSYQAKDRGAKVGMSLDQVRSLVPDLVALESDPQKYHYAYTKLVAIMKSYSPKVTMKSIDEGVIDFNDSRLINPDLLEVATQVKQRLQEQLGNYVSCNIGISTNRFLAKLAAGQNKPDGLTVITSANLVNWLSQLKLTDLPGIAEHYEARLNASNIFTPLDFLKASPPLLRRAVFRSRVGDDWHQRLRGWEVDDYQTKVRSVGRQFVLDGASANSRKLDSRLAELSYSVALKLRYGGQAARGILVYARLQSGDLWQNRKTFKASFNDDRIVYEKALYLFNQRPVAELVMEMGVTCYNLEPAAISALQANLFDDQSRRQQLTAAVDQINGRYGDSMISFAPAKGAYTPIEQKIPFGSTRYFELLCR